MKLTDHGVFLCGGVPQPTAPLTPDEGRRRTMAYRILQAHNQSGDERQLRIRFDAMLSHDITYVGIIQQARASGMKEFPLPYALTNCHNSLCAVGGTINVMLAASRASGTTTIYNAAKEPHIVDLANFLNSMGCRVKGAGTDVIRIRGVQRLQSRRPYAVIPDQIETGTLMIAAAATHGDVTICGCIPTHMEALTAKLLEMGARVEERDDAIRVRSIGDHRAVTFKTQVYPGFPTDLQQPMSALLCTATGTSTVVENIFESRFRHLSEMERMGARVRIYEQTAVIEGVPQLHGAAVEATDLRAGAALVIAGLMAQGTTEIYNTHFIDRGYEHLEEKLNSLGAKISRTRE